MVLKMLRRRRLPLAAPSAVIVAIAAFVLSLAAPGTAQEWKGKGRLQGDVLDAEGKPVAGAKVTLRPGAPPVDPAAGGPAPITTDKRGKWAILGLDNGPWAVLIEKEGFVRSEGQVQVNEYAPAKPIRIALNPAAQETRQAAAANAAGEEALAALEAGNAKLQAGQFAEARAEYEKAMATLEPANHPAVLRGIARTYYQEKKLDQAIASLQKALELKPDDAESRKLVANIYVDKGIEAYNATQVPEAAQQFSLAIENDGTLADAYYYRGLALMAQTKNAEAKADFQKLLELDPNYPQAADVREFLQSL
ncbi:MAG TPA: tetratricopeptide repeat protein [Thermoanaerobaculia bacterium]|nr:tetratricopeptide repeat protein [Thermoanaerobaculia bacterium]